MGGGPSVEAPDGLRFYGVPKQWVEVLPATSADEHPFRYVAFATTDAKQMRLYLAQHGVTVPASVTRWRGWQPGFSRERSRREHGRIHPAWSASAHSTPDPRAISSQMIHAGFQVHSPAAEDGFYKKTLDSRPIGRVE